MAVYRCCSTATLSIPTARTACRRSTSRLTWAGHSTSTMARKLPRSREASPYRDEMSGVMGPVFVRFVASCLSFMEQRITIPVSRPTSRATRRRLERKHDGFQPAAEVQVIELRRRERYHQEHADQGGREPPEWHVQWLVSGHWRRHWYPRAKAHKPRYIAPYIKGPQDKPLKTPTSQLFVVKR
jgi:hypothetical protein